MEKNLKSDDALATPGTSQISRCNIEEFKARLKEQKEAALALRQQAIVNKKKQNLEYRKSQRKKVNNKKLFEVDVSNSQHCISENGIEPIVTTFTSSKQKQQVVSNSVIETPRLKKVAYEREKKRKQREKMRKNPEAYYKYCKLEKERNYKRKAEGKLKSIDQMNPREQRRIRKMWKANKV